MSQRLPMCGFCAHYRAGTMTCAAFPGGIPRAIFFDGNPHLQPFPGDQGLTFEERQDLPQASRQLVRQVRNSQPPTSIPA